MCYRKTSASSSIVVGVFNSGDRISSSAELSDLIGRREDDGYFSFALDQQSNVDENTQLFFQFSADSVEIFRLGECVPPGKAME